MTAGWRVWRAFDTDRERTSGALFKALAATCRDSNGKVDAEDLDYWIEVLVWYRWGDA